MNTVHSFDINDAAKVGVVAAVMLFNIRFWVEKNKANNKHFYDGRYWTYNSVKAFQEMFPYLTPKQIRTALDKLEDSGEIIAGNYNKLKMDHTRWFAVLPEGDPARPVPKGQNDVPQKGKTMCPKGQIVTPKRADGNAQKGNAIPDVNQLVNQIEEREADALSEKNSEAFVNPQFDNEDFFSKQPAASHPVAPPLPSSPPRYPAMNVRSGFVEPTLAEITVELTVKTTWNADKIKLVATKFFNHYRSTGWENGKMICWRSKLGTWAITERNESTYSNTRSGNGYTPAQQGATAIIPEGKRDYGSFHRSTGN